jgi:outer membrane protein OmpA-like peptidoglycan-associated protein
MKKKLKYTQNKLKIDKIKIKKIISHIIKEEPPITKQNNEKMKEKDNSDIEDIVQEGGVSIYLYITLKKDLNDEEKRVFKNKLLKIKYPMINDIIYLCLIEANFDRHSSITPVVIPVPFTTEQYNALAEKVAALEKENAQLKDKIASLEKELAPYRNLVNGQTYLFENGKFTAVEVTNATPLSVYFDLGSSKLSAREKAHLEYFCENAVDADTKLAINAYADKQTGSARGNQKLSEQRAKTVIDFLTKAGAKESNIECNAHGDTINPFNTAAKNRVVTIEVK